MDYPFDISFQTAPDPSTFFNFSQTTTAYNATDKTVDVTVVGGAHGGFLLGSTPAVSEIMFGAEIMFTGNLSGFTDNIFGMWLSPWAGVNRPAAWRLGNQFSSGVNGWYVTRTFDGGSTASRTPIRQSGVNGVPAFSTNVWYDLRVEYLRSTYVGQGNSIMRFYVNGFLIQELEELGAYSTDVIPGVAIYSSSVKVRRIYGSMDSGLTLREPSPTIDAQIDSKKQLPTDPLGAIVDREFENKFNYYAKQDITIRGRVLNDDLEPSSELVYAVDSRTLQPLARVASKEDGFYEIPGMDSSVGYTIMVRRDDKMRSLPYADYTGFGELAGTYRIRGQNIGAVEVHVHSEQTGEYLGKVMTDSNGQFRVRNINANHMFALVFREPSGAWEDRVSSRRIPELTGYTLEYESNLTDDNDRIKGAITILDGYEPYTASAENLKPGVGLNVIGNRISFFGETIMQGPYSIPITVKSIDGGEVVVPVSGVAGYPRSVFHDGSIMGAIELEAQVDRVDPYFTSVRSLLHFDPDTVSGSTAIDKSTFSVPWTIPSGVSIDTTTAKFGGSMRFTTSDRGIYTTDGSALPGTGDFTVEMWIRPDGGSVSSQILFSMRHTNGWDAYAFISGVTRNISFYWGGSGLIMPTDLNFPVAGDVWTHFALCRAGGVTRVFQNGIRTNGTITAWDTGSTTAGARMAIGGFPTTVAGPNPFRGNIDEFRYTRGIARYTDHFIPPTKPYQNM